jgi:uncharacterized protein (DUF924 family)
MAITVHFSADQASAVLDFWFDNVGEAGWFAKDPALDSAITQRFGALREAVAASKAIAWRDTPEHLLAAILLIDQFGRNIHRGSAKAFADDALARDLALAALERGWVERAPLPRRAFFLMPLMHSESLADQDRSVAEFERLGDPNSLAFAHSHRDQIARFGRFPGRNAALGRRTTRAEQAALDDGAAF